MCRDNKWQGIGKALAKTVIPARKEIKLSGI